MRALLLLGAVLVGVAASIATAAPPTATCASIIDPDGASAAAWRPKRVVLDVVAVPAAYIPQTTASGIARWPYWSKSGLVVRADSPVVHVSVAAGWRRRAAIGWGDPHAVSSLRIVSCAASSTLPGWNPYAGGFYLRSRAACVPLTFRAGERSATVRFGVGKRCA